MDIEDLFEKEMQKDTVFLDRNVLSPHFVPETLPHRDKQIQELMQKLAPSLSGKTISNIFLYGKTGTGKTVSTKHVIDKLMAVKKKYGASVECVYTNCRILNTKYQVMLKVAEYCHPDESFLGFPFSHLFQKIVDYVQSNSLGLILVLDEVDKVKNLDDLVYTITRANDELAAGGISMIGISNNIAFKESLDPRSKSALSEDEIVFPPYNAEELKDILEQRVKLGFKQGTIDESSINYASALAANESGDARYALRLLFKAGEIADLEGAKKVTDKHVELARKGVENEIVYSVVKTLPEHQKILLHAIAQLSKEGGHYARLDGTTAENVLFTGEVYDRYNKICRVLGKEPRTARWCKEYMNELEMLGLITTTISGKGVRGNTTLIRLAYPAQNIIDLMKKQFGGE